MLSLHEALKSNDLKLQLEHTRGKAHQTKFFLYNIEPFMLCGDVSTNRELNVPDDNFMILKNQCLSLDKQDFTHTMIAHHEFQSNSSKGLILLRLHFVV